jgi:PKD repeat protein
MYQILRLKPPFGGLGVIQKENKKCINNTYRLLMNKKLIYLCICFIALLYVNNKTIAQTACSITGEADNATYPGIFKDAICSSLNVGVTQDAITAMPDGFYKSMAQCMFNRTYDITYRVQSFEPYPTVETTARILKVSTYSQFENPTGIFFDAESTVTLFVENTFGQFVYLKVFDYGSNASSTYLLNTGLNKITVKNKGLGYIDYYTDDYASLQAIKIHIVSGKINGYYDVNATTAIQWKALLANSVTQMIDLKGKYIGLNCDVNEIKKYSPNDARELVQFYDTIVGLQFQQMGLFKYNRVPKNHMYGEIDGGNWSWYAGGRGAHWSGGCESTLNPVKAKNDCWGLAHELGHVNQMRPGLKWVGTGEVTNNVYSAWAKYLFSTTANRFLEVEKKNDAYYSESETGGGGLGNEMEGGRFNAYFNNGIIKKQQWMCQYGPDAMTAVGPEKNWKNAEGDHFVKLCALWQLELYYQLVHPEKKDWYGIVAEKVRNTDESTLSEGELYVNFMKNTCDAVGEDLTDFFKAAGMLRTYDRLFGDYGYRQFTVTAADSAGVLSYVASKGYPKPETPVLHYITANSLDTYKNKLAMIGGAVGEGCTPMLAQSSSYQKYITVDHAVWKNVVVFETYADTKLIRISMVGSGYSDISKSRVYYPNEATAIYAVGYDGSKKMVYSSAATSAAPQVKFLADKVAIPVGDAIHFRDFSFNTPTAWAWSFKGGSPSTSAECNPSVSYSTPGKYSVTLTASNAVGKGVLTKYAYITVSPDLALGKTVTTSSDESDGYGGRKAVDGDAKTRWASNCTDDEWIAIDMQKQFAIDRVVLRWEDAYGKDYNIEVSSDGTTWTTLKQVRGNVDLLNDYSGLAGVGRYIRMKGIARGTDYGYSLFSFEVYKKQLLPNIALNKPVTVSSASIGFEGTKAIDGNTATAWSSNSSVPQWIVIDLQSNYAINRVVLNWATAYGKDFNIEVSSDKATWTSLKMVTGNTLLTNDFTGFSNSARYIRLSITASAAGLGCTLNELEVNGEQVLTNIALNKMVTVSSTQKAGCEGSKAVDGVATTRWSSECSDPQWISIDLQETYNIDKIVLKWEAALGKNFNIEISSDGTTWTTIVPVVDNGSLINEFADLAEKGRYVRMSGTARGTSYGYSLFEFEVYGTKYDAINTSNQSIKFDNKIKIYPNPASSEVYIDLENAFNENELVHLSISDLQGRVLVHRELRSDRQIHLNLDNFAKNQPYFVKIKGDNRLIAKKLIIKD